MTASLWDGSLRQFRERLAAGTPTPGGGALAAASGSLAAALLRMVCAIARRKASDADKAAIDAIETEAKQCEAALAQCADDDVHAFDAYIRARNTSTPAEAQRLLVECAEVPLRGAETVSDLESSIPRIETFCPEFARSDLETAKSLMRASLESLLANVKINLNALEDCPEKADLATRYDRMAHNVNRRDSEIRGSDTIAAARERCVPDRSVRNPPEQ